MTLTDEQIEKVAKAAHKSRAKNMHMPSHWDCLHEWERIVERRAARAALEAVMPEGEPATREKISRLIRSETLATDEVVNRLTDALTAAGYHPAPEPGELERLREVNKLLRDTLEWYEGMLAGVWKDNLWGEASRLILANDRGHRARTALAEGGRDE